MREKLGEVGNVHIIQGLLGSIRSLGFILSVLRNHWNEAHQNYVTILEPHTQNTGYETLHLWRNLTLNYGPETLNGQTSIGPGVSS